MEKILGVLGALRESHARSARCFGALVVFGMSSILAIGETERQVTGLAYEIPGPHSNSGFVALRSSPAGKVYAGTANYGLSARVWELDPRSEEWSLIFDAHPLTRTLLEGGLNTQSKFQAHILVDRYGVIWGATKHGNEIYRYRPEYGEEREGYPGGYLFSYDPKTGDTRNWGILVPQEGLMGGFYDPEHHLLYFWADPKRELLRFDPVANTVANLGSIGGGPRYKVKDREGRIWGTVTDLSPGVSGALWYLDPETDEIKDVLINIPQDHAYREPYTMIYDPAVNRIIAGVVRRDVLYDFDLGTLRASDNPRYHEQIDVTVITGVTSGFNRGIALGLDGAVYMAISGGLGRYWPEKKVWEDLGQVRFSNHTDWIPEHPQGMCVGPDGTLFIMYLGVPRKAMPYAIAVFPQISQPQ